MSSNLARKEIGQQKQGSGDVRVQSVEEGLKLLGRIRGVQKLVML